MYFIADFVEAAYIATAIAPTILIISSSTQQ